MRDELDPLVCKTWFELAVEGLHLATVGEEREDGAAHRHMRLVKQTREGVVVIGRVGLGHIVWQQDGHLVFVIVARGEDACVHRLVRNAVEARCVQEMRERLSFGGGKRGRGEDEAARLRV